MACQQPNILVLMTDQQRFDTLAALGNSIIKTPAMDRLVREGTSFTRCYTPSPVCVSARCAMTTGLPAHRTHCTDNVAMPEDVPSFMDRLSAVGYQAHGVGKMHFSPDPQRLWGFESRDVSEELNSTHDDYVEFLHAQGQTHLHAPLGLRSEYYYIPQPSQMPASQHHSSWVADRSIDFLKRRDRNRPFCLWSSWIKPHPPFESPAPWYNLYRCAEMEAPFQTEDDAQFMTIWNRIQNRYKYRDAGQDALLLRTLRAAYYACISFIDYNLGRLLDALGDEIDNTLILFTSDHGEMLGDYSSVGKRCMLDPAVRVPMLVRYPAEFEADQRCDTPVSLLDVMPTVCAAAGIASPRVCRQGQDLALISRGEDAGRTVFSQFQQRHLGLYMAADRHYKYIYSTADRKEWLFDQNRDDPEQENLAADAGHAQVTRQMRQRLWDQFLEDGYTDATEDGQNWCAYPQPDFLKNPDDGLLFQDGASLQERINQLGPGYRRDVTKSEPNAIKLIWDTIQLTRTS